MYMTCFTPKNQGQMLITLRVRLSTLVVYVLEISMNASVTPSKIYKKLHFKTKT